MTMHPFQTVMSRLKQRIAQDRLLSNIGWYSLAEGSARVSRIFATIFLARYLSAAELGIAAVAITCFEIVRTFANNGIGPMVIKARATALDATCNTAFRLGWYFCIAMAICQCAAGFVIFMTTGQAEIFPLVACLAAVFLIMPFGLINVYLLMRAGNIRCVAQIATAQMVADNVLTAILAIAGFGPWAIVLPKVLTAPIWLYGVRRGKIWDANPAAGNVPVADFVKFSAPLLGSEILTAARLQLDKVMVGSLLGLEALGVYYFVFNAGIGFSLSLTMALTNSIYPELVRFAGTPYRLLKRYKRALATTVAPISAVIALQALATMLYVPIVFGAKWTAIAPLVGVLCASAITKPFYDSAVQLLRAAGATRYEFAASSILTTISLGSLAAGLHYDLWHGVAALSASLFIVQFALAVWARKVVAGSASRRKLKQSNDFAPAEGLAAA
ncbi:MAG: oligosaccharide flippase family protein [Hyphomicrobium sp.]|nr:oligosaccharide flippase family protein [Hyphomicrobium sp.]